MTDWIFFEGQAKDMFEEANTYGVKAKEIKIKDIKRFARSHFAPTAKNLKNFKVAVDNEKYSWNDVIQTGHKK